MQKKRAVKDLQQTRRKGKKIKSTDNLEIPSPLSITPMGQTNSQCSSHEPTAQCYPKSHSHLHMIIIK